MKNKQHTKNPNNQMQQTIKEKKNKHQT